MLFLTQLKKKIFYYYISEEGKHINHCSVNYNTDIVSKDHKIYKLVAVKDIKKDEELTNNYDLINKKFPFIGRSKEGYQTCYLILLFLLLQKMSIEIINVQNVYDKIASDFDNTRYRPWSYVESFLDNVPSNSTIGDIGCGNGKNMLYRKDCTNLGCDFSIILFPSVLKNLNVISRYPQYTLQR